MSILDKLQNFDRRIVGDLVGVAGFATVLIAAGHAVHGVRVVHGWSRWMSMEKYADVVERMSGVA